MSLADIEEAKKWLESHGVREPGVVERVAAIGDQEKTLKILADDLLIQNFALAVGLQIGSHRKMFDETFIVSATDKPAMERLAKLIGYDSAQEAP